MFTGKRSWTKLSSQCHGILVPPPARTCFRCVLQDDHHNLSDVPAIHPDAIVVASTLGRYTEVGARTRLNEVEMGDYSYIVTDGQIDMARIGKFCSIASHTRINPGNHPHERASQSHFLYRASRYFDGEPDEAGFFDWRRSHAVTIGHDVWIGHGAVILARASGRHGRCRCCRVGRYQGCGALHDRRRQSGPRDQAAFFAIHRYRLMALAWWDWDHERLRRALPDFRALGVEAFLERHGG